MIKLHEVFEVNIRLNTEEVNELEDEVIGGIHLPTTELNYFKWLNIQVIVIPEKVGGSFKEIVTKIFPNLNSTFNPKFKKVV